MPGIRLGCSVDSCVICPSRSLRILGTGTETEKQRLQKLGKSWEGCPGEYQEKAPEVDKRQSRAGEGAEGLQEGVGHQGCEQMEGICFAELNSSACEVWKNLMGMVSS